MVSVDNHSYVRSVPAVVVPVVPPVWPVVLPAWHLLLWNCGPVLALLQWVFGRLECKEGCAIAHEICVYAYLDDFYAIFLVYTDTIRYICI